VAVTLFPGKDSIVSKELKPVALQLYSVRQAAAQDFFGVLKTVADIGYAGVETAGLHNKPAAEVRKVVEDLGMKVCSAHMPLPTAETLQQTVDTVKALGCATIVNGRGSKEFDSLDKVKAHAELYEKAIALLAPHGVRVAYHNHWWEMAVLDGRLAYDELLRLAPNLKGELDVYWASNFGAQDPAKICARHKARLPLLHIKDGPLVKDQPHTAVGAGKVDIAACVAAADRKVLQWLIVELDACATDMATAVRESCVYLTSRGLGKGRK